MRIFIGLVLAITLGMSNEQYALKRGKFVHISKSDESYTKDLKKAPTLTIICGRNIRDISLLLTIKGKASLKFDEESLILSQWRKVVTKSSFLSFIYDDSIEIGPYRKMSGI